MNGFTLGVDSCMVDKQELEKCNFLFIIEFTENSQSFISIIQSFQ